ncbi:MAG: homogentisate 1,2-dioxygenase [Pseudomonadota bacterium]|nr:homogentisate 1,2-dioxygenase [Pseudomonadota bacterium]
MHNYLSGLGNNFSSEALKGSLPKQQNSPQQVPYGLYAEQLNCSAFTMPRARNFRTWLYKINPSVKQGQFKHLSKPSSAPQLLTAPIKNICPPTQMRWNKLDMLHGDSGIDFIDSLTTIAANGDVTSLSGSAIHIYRAVKSMDRIFYNADGELLIIPQEGRLLIRTELGELEVEPLEIVVIPRGIKFQVKLLDNIAYGYVNENYGAPFQLPELGPIGANGLANPRDFLAPVAKYEDVSGDFELICKFEGELWSTQLSASPFDVVAWHGNCVPYKYDLRKFNTIGSISFDHPDPSIFTVLTSPTTTPGLANVDFVIFPPRWLVANHTFRPPWYHRNIMSEYMGLLLGQYDAKINGGFDVGGGSLHNRMSPHGPDNNACVKAINKELSPEYLDNTMAFMLESSMTWRISEFALTTDKLQTDYLDCWQTIAHSFAVDKK